MKTISAPSRQCRLRMLGIVTAGVLAAGALFAQVPAPRIHSEINSSEATILAGSQHPLANLQNDAGRVPAGTRLNGITLYFNRSAAQQAELDALMAAQQNPSSPQYHKWITPDQYAARFGMAQADIDKTRSWLERQGFSIDMVMRSRNAIRFSGTVGQVESAFHTQMHYYMAGGEEHFAPAGPLSLPASLQPVVAGVRNLDDFRPRAQHISARRSFTSGVSGKVYFSPGDIVTTYDIQPLYDSGINGSGQTIAIMGQSWVDVSDVEAFQSAAGLTVKDPQLVIVPGSGNDSTPSAGDESESDLDLEWSGAIATGAKVVFVYTGSDVNYGVYESVQYAVDNLIGTIISISYSTCETELSSSNLSMLEGITQQAKLQGQTVMAASGDSGSTACYGYTNLTTAQQEAVAVNYPASSAYVTGVGGTEIQANALPGGSNFSTYWNSTSGTDVISSAKKWIPEIVWNDDDPSYGLSATGGGTSALVSRPSWQKGVPGIPSGSMRLVPDIAFYSSPGAPGYLYCTSDSSAWGSSQTGSCGSGFRASSSDTSLTLAGGTSFATPIFAGMVALLNQNGNYVTGAGDINTTLYTLASNSTTYSTAFHDVTSGNNNCTAGSNYCSQTDGFSAHTGYDQVTGLGSVDLYQLSKVWPANSGSSASLISTSVAVTPANSTPSSGADDVFTIAVSSQTGSTIPSGTVTLQVDGGTTWGAGGTTVSNVSLDANGTASYTANFTGSGTHQVLAQYSGDATHAASAGVGEVFIGGTAGKGSIALAASNVTTRRGTTGTSTITVTPSGGYTGTVVLTFDFGSADSTLQNLCYAFTTMDNNGNGTVQVTGASAVTTQLSLDTNASDCVSSNAIKGTGNRVFKNFSAGRNGHAGNSAPRKPGDSRLPAGIAFAGLLLAGLLGRHSRKLRNVACIVALAAAGFAVNACGGSSGPSDPPKGTYNGTITGTDSVTSTITSTTTFTFTIN